jgi:hypothetical protein
MKRHILLAILLFLLLAYSSGPASAQVIPGRIVDTTYPLDTAVRDALDDWLAVSPPAPVQYYAVTYSRVDGMDTLVSLVGLDIADPDDPWTLEGEQAVWIGSVRVRYNGEIVPLYQPEQVNAFKVLARTIRAAGGGSYVRFPWQAGKGVMYGPRGVHAAGYGTSGMVAVDLVGGSSIGSNIAGPGVYASDAGTVDYVCEDGTSVAIRTHNSSTGDYFIYAHLQDNANLELDHEFSAGASIGTLRYGSFDDSCGWADQQSTNYHLHWGIVPSGGTYQAEGCILSDGKWHCGSNTVSPTQILYHTNAIGADDPGGSLEVTFFDQLLLGLIQIFDRGVVKLLPEHDSPTLLIRLLANGIILTFRVAFVLLKGNFNLGPLMAMLAFAIGYKLIFGTVWIVLVVLRAIKSLVPAA